MGSDLEALDFKDQVVYNVREIPAAQDDERKDAVFGELHDKGPNYRAVSITRPCSSRSVYGQ